MAEDLSLAIECLDIAEGALEDALDSLPSYTFGSFSADVERLQSRLHTLIRRMQCEQRRQRQLAELADKVPV